MALQFKIFLRASWKVYMKKGKQTRKRQSNSKGKRIYKTPKEVLVLSWKRSFMKIWKGEPLGKLSHCSTITCISTNRTLSLFFTHTDCMKTKRELQVPYGYKWQTLNKKK